MTFSRRKFLKNTGLALALQATLRAQTSTPLPQQQTATGMQRLSTCRRNERATVCGLKIRDTAD
jgi:hypothetical protein